MLSKFYGDILPAEGFYCLTLLPEGRHLWVDNLDELGQLTTKYEDREGVYYGTAAFTTTENRKQSNVLALKALRLDIDAGEKKHAKDPEGTYPDQRTALTAAVAFFKASGFAPTYIVSSGEGLHVYYCLDTAIEPDHWVRLARGLGVLATSLGLRTDSSVTTDSARILRPIGGLHRNGSRVAVMRDTGAVYSADALAGLLPVEAPVRKFDMSVNDELDLSFQGPPSSALKVAEHCGALREVAASGGDVPEPHWRAMIGLVKRTVEGLDIAHEWSAGYDGYDAAEVERKFHNWSAGPTTCSEFAKHSKACATCKHSGKIKSPINLGLMTTPEIEQLPEEVQVEVAPPPVAPAPTGDPWDGHIPPGFDVVTGRTGVRSLVYALQTEKESDSGDIVPVIVHVPFTHDIFWFGPCAGAEHSDDTAVVTLYLWNGAGVRSYLMDQTLVASQSKLLEYLSGKAIQTTTHKRAAQAMQDYSKALLQRVKTSNSRPKIADHLGMRVMDDGQLVAAHGKHVIFPDGTIKEAFLASNLRSVAGQFPLPIPANEAGEWDASVWDEYVMPKAVRHIEFFKKHYGRAGTERFQLAIMLGLASPLMAFVTASFFSGSTLPRMSALSVSLYSKESARGKTTAVSSAILAYGKASDLTNDSGKVGTTDIARISRLSLHGTMPNIMDEMGGASAASVAQTVSAVANGTGRARADKTGGLVETTPWALINLITTNTSQRDMIASIQDTSGAIQYRLLEINCEDMPEYDQELRDSFTDDWAALNRDCAGALGGVIHRELVAMGAAGVTKLVTECCSRASQILKSDQTARFQYRALGAMLALQLILTKRGLAPFALPGLVEAFRVAHDAGRDFVIDNVMPTDGLELLSRALQDLAPHTLVTENETHTTGTSAKFDEPLNARVPDVIHARHIKSLGRTYVAVHALKDWAREKGVSDRDIVMAAKKAAVLIPVSDGSIGVNRTSRPFNLTKGLRSNMSLRANCYAFDVRQLYGAKGEPGGNVVTLRPGADIPETSAVSQP